MKTIREELGRVADSLEEVNKDRQRRLDRESREYLDAHRGRREPVLVDLGLFILAAPWQARCFQTEVPDEFWIRNKTGAAVSCPCGEVPEIEPDHLTECACGRIFIYTGKEVRVWREENQVDGVT